MSSLLRLDSSADLTGSVSRLLTARFADGWTAAGHTIVRRDLFLDQPRHLPNHELHWAAELRTAGTSVTEADERYQQELIDELLAADVVLIGAPMYNWSVPSTLKAWIDWIHVAGTTAPASPTQPAALGEKPLVLVSARGGPYGGTSGNVDHQLAALSQLFASSMQMTLHPVLAELTLSDRVEDLAPFRTDAAAALAAAEKEIDRLVTVLG